MAVCSSRITGWGGFLANLLRLGGAFVRMRLLADARMFQILFLASFLAIGVLARDFSLRGEQMLLTFASGLVAQWWFLRCFGLRSAGYLSAIVTCFGLSILLRADSWWIHPGAAAIAIAAKFLVRVGDKHLYNPANVGVVLATSLFPGAWISPGQWGSDFLLFGWFLALGLIVCARARCFDTSLAFIGAFGCLIAARVVWLDQSWAVAWHQLQSGALLLFTFFMISDPMTTPNRRAARLVFSAIVALVAFAWQFVLHETSGPVWALFLAAPLVPLADRLWPAARHAWRRTEAKAG